MQPASTREGGGGSIGQVSSLGFCEKGELNTYNLDLQASGSWNSFLSVRPSVRFFMAAGCRYSVIGDPYPGCATGLREITSFSRFPQGNLIFFCLEDEAEAYQVGGGRLPDGEGRNNWSGDPVSQRPGWKLSVGRSLLKSCQRYCMLLLLLSSHHRPAASIIAHWLWKSEAVDLIIDSGIVLAHRFTGYLSHAVW